MAGEVEGGTGAILKTNSEVKKLEVYFTTARTLMMRFNTVLIEDSSRHVINCDWLSA